MIKINDAIVHVSTLEPAIRGMRNPMNSWDNSDSYWDELGFIVGKRDFELMKKLVLAGTDHGKFMRMITVSMDITAPLYWWKEFDTYKIGTVANSCSTMHKIHNKEFELDDFSHDHLQDKPSPNYLKDIKDLPEWVLKDTIDCLNIYRQAFLDTKDKKYWWQIIQMLPSSYNQTRTVMLNFAVLRNMYFARRNHKLDEWHVFCDTITSLPYSELIIIQ